VDCVGRHHGIGAASMEQMVVQLLAPRNAKHHFCKSRKSDEMFGVVKGGEVKAGCLTQLIEH